MSNGKATGDYGKLPRTADALHNCHESEKKAIKQGREWNEALKLALLLDSRLAFHATKVKGA